MLCNRDKTVISLSTAFVFPTHVAAKRAIIISRGSAAVIRGSRKTVGQFHSKRRESFEAQQKHKNISFLSLGLLEVDCLKVGALRFGKGF